MMKTYMTRIFTVALLMMISMGAKAEVEVKIGEFTGGKITASQGDEKNGEVVVTLTVAPDDGYTITKKDIEVYATISPKGTRADDPEISGTLELKGNDPSDLSEKRDYTVTVKSNFGVWVKSANFAKKRDGGAKSTPYTFYVINNSGKQSVKATASVESTSTVLEAFKATTTSVLSPLIASDADYYFYDTEAAAIAATGFTSGGGNGSSTVATIDSNDDKTIYVRYFFDASSCSIDLTGTVYYNIKIGGRYLAFNNDRGNRPETIASGEVTAEALQYSGLTGIYHYLFKLYGNDPYNIAVINTYNNSTTRRLWGQWNTDGTSSRMWLKDISGTINNYNLFTKNLGSYILLTHNSETNYALMAATSSNQPNTNSQYGYLLNRQVYSGNKYTDPCTCFVPDANADAVEIIPAFGCETPTVLYDNTTGNVTISSLTTGATIYYTASTSGTAPNDPTSSSYDGTGTTPVVISNVYTPTIYKAKAIKSGLDDSGVVTQAIGKLSNPSVSFSDATQKVTITTNSVVEGATSVYTTDGNNPTTSSDEYSEPISLTETTTVKAMTVKDGYINSDPVSLTVTKLASAPTISKTGSTVTLSYAEDGTAPIHYTTDGTTPTLASSTYSEPFSLVGEQKFTIKAIATKTGYLHSDAAEEVIDNRSTIPAPTISVEGNTVTITANDIGDEIYYTTDGSTPTTSTETHFTTSGTFNLENGNNYTINAIASNGDISSSEATETVDLTVLGLSGIYYLQSNSNKTYYMCPSATTKEEGKPYVQTKQEQKIASVWKLIMVSPNTYRIQHYEDSKYMVATSTKDEITNSVWLETTGTPGDNTLFEITETSVGSGIYTIKPAGADNTNSKNYLNVTGNNGSNHTIGLLTDNDPNSKWLLMAVPAAPTFSVSDNKVTINNPFGAGTIYYTTDGTTPTSESSAYSKTITLKYGPSYTVKAICVYHDNISGMDWTSEVASRSIKAAVLNPIISRSGDNVTITSSQASGVTFRYTFSSNGTDPADPVPPSGAGDNYSSALSLTPDARNVFKAIAYNTVDGTTYKSSVVTFIVDLRGATTISSLAGITSATGSYKLASDFTATGTPQEGGVEIGTSTNPFKGTIDGNYTEISLNAPLFECIEDATIKNVIVSSVSISGGTNAGTIANEAKGASRIYNCGVKSGSVSGSGDVGSIIGKLSDFSRVINCYSYANITGGSNKGGIVGNNTYASKATDIRTMVMNCMYYGNLSGGYPIYGGSEISNLHTSSSNGLNNYNYYAYSKLTGTINGYNGALAAEDEYLDRYEFYRQLLNSNRKLAAWYVFGDGSKGEGEDTEMAKWVLDKSIAPYPILKKQDYYPSVVNYDVDNTYIFNSITNKWEKEERTNISKRSNGGLIKKNNEVQTLKVKINSVGSGAPSGAKILDKDGNVISDPSSTPRELVIKRTDKDTLNYNFNYDKIQLPYYNSVGKGNYTGNKVVTGWKITGFSGGTPGTYVAQDAWNDDGKGYNFADRNCTNKDLYGTGGSNRVFSQGAYYDVPYGVTEITIEPYWGNALYVGDAKYDVVYNSSYGEPTTVTDVQFTNAGDYSINGNSQKVYTSISSALNSLTSPGSTVYDNAIVLVGNLHQVGGLTSSNSKPITIMSADLDFDNEPDYSLIYNHSGRADIYHVRFDFINIPGTAMAQKPKGVSTMRNVSTFKPRGWFEVTNTCLVRFTQFEYDNGNKTLAPLILLGGQYDQIVSTKTSDPDHYTEYIHIGGNAWFNEFNNGTHSDGSKFTPHVPISVTGGDYDKFYLSGIYKPTATVKPDDAECYISGGRFGEVAGAGMQQIDGDVKWQIYDADIRDFYGGGINAKKNITGNITIDIYNSHVKTYCGGPKFGDMESGKVVTTNAEGCTFGSYYGAGYGGASLNRLVIYNTKNNINWTTWAGAYTGIRGQYKSTIDANYGDNNNFIDKNADADGIATDFGYEYFTGTDGSIYGRLYVYFASFSMAKTHNVNSYLNGCTIAGDFYGGGKFGEVDGKATSELTNCTVYGNAFGGGFSGAVPKIAVRDAGFSTLPSYNADAGVFVDGVLSGTTEFEWTTVTSDLVDGVSQINESSTPKTINTKVNFSTLGQVGETELSIKGNTYVRGMMGGTIPVPDNGFTGIDGKTLYGVKTGGELAGGVFGGGDASAVQGNSVLSMQATTLKDGASYNVYNVFGGGNEADVKGNTQVNMSGGTVSHNVFGGGKGSSENYECDKAMVGVNNAGAGADPAEEANKDKGTKVIITDGTVNGNVYGGGELGRVEWNTQVTIGTKDDTNNSPRPLISGSVFGAGAGVETHGYSALVRGNSTVTVQGKAKVSQNVYGGGEKATVGRYWVKGINNKDAGGNVIDEAKPVPDNLPDGMPYKQQSGGICTVTIQGNAQIGPDNGGTATAGHVFGAGKGVLPQFDANTSKKMTKDDGLVTFTDENGKTAEEAYIEFLQTLALVTNSNVTINGSATVKGSVYGGSESGYVQHNTNVIVKGGTIGTQGQGGANFGNVYGGGKGDAEHTGTNENYYAAGIVKGSTKVTIQNTMDEETILYSPTILHNVYGGGAYGTVGVFDYGNDGLPTSLNADAPENSGKTEIHITGGTIGTTGDENGMIFGSSRGDVGAIGSIHDKLAWVFDTEVKIGTSGSGSVFTTPTIKGSVYGGGENGHNYNNANVYIYSGTVGIPTGETIGSYSGAYYPYRGNVYGGGCGTDKYDNNTKFNPKAGIVQGNATVNISGGYVVHNVYGAGAMGSVGTTTSGGKTTVTISGGRVGYDGERNGNVFGAARGEYGTSTAESGLANVRETELNISYTTTPAGDDANKTTQLIAGSVFGGGESGTVKENVTVNMTGGLILKDLYGGGALAHTQTSNWDATANSNAGGWAEGKSSSSSTTTVNLLGGTIHGEAYGGGLGEANKPAYVYGDVLVDLNGTTTSGETGTFKTRSTRGCAVYEVFGCNNVNGTPKGNVLVHVYGTQHAASTMTNIGYKYNPPYYTPDQQPGESKKDYLGRLITAANGVLPRSGTGSIGETETGITASIITAAQEVYAESSPSDEDLTSAITGVKAELDGLYDVHAVYGGGNQAAYEPVAAWNGTTGSKSKVIVEGCDYSSIQYVYGGGNAAPVPETNVLIKGTKIIDYLFGGGNGTVVGADVGYKKDGSTEQGTGNANTTLMAGTIHYVYGASNTNGNIRGTASIDKIDSEHGTTDDGCCSNLNVNKMYSAGKDADMVGGSKVVLGCMSEDWIEEYYGGAENANVLGDVELTITSGNFRKVFGGNKTSGAILGHIKLNIEETGCIPINIDELYGCGNNAPYSVYGFYDTGNTNPSNGKKIFAVRESATDSHKPVNTSGEEIEIADFTPYDPPVVNIISATRIGQVFGGGYGSGATVYGNPTVNINQIYGIKSDGNGGYTTATELGAIGSNYTDANSAAVVGGVYGGGNQAKVIGNTTVNIGTETKVAMTSLPKVHAVEGDPEYLANTAADQQPMVYQKRDVLGAKITGNVYGGGKKADVGQYDVANDHVDVVGNTYVNIGAKEVTVDNNQVWQSVTEGTSKVTIGGNVFGGGEGEAAESGDGAFKCAKAIVTGETNIHIGNGTINGTVYGGGEVGRVEGDAVVAIGIGAGGTTPASAPEIKGDVFGAGKGKKTHGYSALLRGNPTVTIEGDAKVRGSVYGGGEIASVGRYNVKKGDNDPEGAPADVLPGMPYSLANSGSGYCTIIIRGNAEIGPETEMKMVTASGIPDDTGHVIGGGKGVLPYDGYGVTGDDWVGDPWRVSINDEKDIFNSTYYTDYEKEYFKYIETLALATETNVTIAGNAFVKGSVYGGSLNGHVQHDTHVNIAGGQIGQGEGVTKGRYSTSDWNSESLAECPHWDYVANSGAPYDPLATESGTYVYTNYDFVPDASRKTQSEGGLPIAKDGHTYYGNVFGGGSGVIPYAPGLWHRGAGTVGGDTYVNITGGHILSSVYGGNEHTDVGTYVKDASGQPTTTPAATNARGKCTINITGGTVGVPRTVDQKQAHPLVGNVFGAGKGDQRIFFNTWTNVINTEVNISGNARIFGSVFGGGEDGHVISDAETNIGNVTIKTAKNETENATANGLIIGTTGTSYSDGNVFGGGRGFSGDAQTAGTVGGNTRVNINAGSVYGSVYGGGRLASVGTMFELPTKDGDPNPAYGQFKEDSGSNTYGHVTINISGGTIGNPAATGDGAVHSGNVFGGSMGRLELLNGTRNPIWPKMAQVKETNVNIYGTAVVRRSVYGGGELGTVRDDAYVTIGGYKTGDANANGEVPVTLSAGETDNPTTVRRDVYGGGYGSEDRNYTIFTIPELISTNPDAYESHTYAFTPMQFAGCVGKSTYVNVAGGYIRKSVFGGGEMASVGVINYRAAETTSEPAANQVKIGPIGGKTYYYTNMVKHGDPATGFALSWPYKFEYVDGYPGATHVKVTGGRLGLKDGETEDGFADNGDVYGAGKGKAGDFKDYLFCANVGSTDVKIAYTSTPEAYTGTGDLIAGAVYGGGEDGHVMGDTKLTISGGLIYHSVYGGGSGKGLYNGSLLKIGATEGSATESDYYPRNVYSITAGKVFGNTEVNMSGGYVVRNIYGGGNMGSVGKGNYAGGSDDYSTDGYGEKVANLWSNTDFTGSGKCKVTISGGTIGYINPSNPGKSMYPLDANKEPYAASLPYGNVFGGCRGEAAPDLDVTPSYLYSPEFFMGYVNETEVTIEGADTKILGSVYGGGMDGHVRRDASVTVKGGVIGMPFTDANKQLLGGLTITDNTTNKVSDNIQWLARGNVYGAGSGIGEYDASVVQYSSSYTGTQLTGTGNSTSAGSVTRFTKVDIQGGTIYRNVYGGGSLASVGAPKINQDYFEYRKGDTTDGHGVGKQTLNEVVISGGNIGDDNSYDANGNHVYGGHVFGGSRGDATLDATKFSTSMFTSITVNANATPANSPVIKGSVFGGGEVGIVKGSVDVNINGGTINDDVYGGGALANTNTETSSNVPYTTVVNLTGGLIKGDAYGGGLGQLGTAVAGVHYSAEDTEVIEGTKTTNDWKVEPVAASEGAGAVKAMVYGDVSVNLGIANADGTPNLSSSATAFNVTLYGETGHTDVVKSGRIFGCNNLNGSPMGNVTVTVNKTKTVEGAARTAEADKNNKNATHTYDLADVYGGGNLANYTPNNGQVKVIINSCDVSVQEVYGGGNAASVPATDVEVRGAYEIAQVFGGGNGEDDYYLNGEWHENSGANVGGDATTLLTGGYIHEAYGGSNSKGTISGNINISKGSGGRCDLTVEDLYGAGKDADVEGDLIMVMGCSETRTENVYGCSMNANVKGNVELTITSGEYGKVFGGNNKSGAIFGHIIVNVEETGCTPIIIDELYACGNDAAYSVYGYYQDGTIEGTTKPKYVARKSLTDGTAVTFEDKPHTDPGENGYDDPVVNIYSCTRIGKVFGGGYGAGATVYGNPKVNINMMPGKYATDGKLGQVGCGYTNADNEAVEGGVFGGGNEAKVEGSTTVNIGNMVGEEIDIAILDSNGNPVKDSDGKYTYTKSSETTVTGANITGNVYGGGNLADVTGNTFVNICAKKSESGDDYVAVPEGDSKVNIGGTVYGGGKGKEDTFLCEKAMIGENGLGANNPNYPNGNTSVRIGHGTVKGSVYGGGEVGRVEMNTVVEIGYGDGGSGSKTPVIEGNVFGAGAGVKTHGYSALVRGNTHVTIQGDTWVKKSVYGGGEIASVARYNVAQTDAEGAPYGVYAGEPYLLANPNSGYCYVTVQGHAEIGPDGMQMYHKENGTIPDDDKPDDWGHVFAAGKGVLPETYNFTQFKAADRKNYPKRMALYDSDKYVTDDEYVTWEYVDPEHKETNKNIWEYFNTEAKYFTFIQTLGLATQTEATIDGSALVKGSVYGGSENGLVQFNTNVILNGNCQIGVAEGEDKPDCAHWEFKAPYAPYDPYAKYLNDGEGGDNMYYYDENHTKDADGGAKIATDGHTYYGNVFGGGSGSIPYFNTIDGKSEYIMSAGMVKGNTYVTISGGHILTNVYGGCEATNVLGTANVTMTAGTVGVDRTEAQIIAHPLTGYIFGGGKGDQRIFFNKDTNVGDAIVKVEGGRVYGSVYGGGEDGHVLRHVTLTIGKSGETTGPTIGTRGTSYYDGHVFGSGRGFGGDALTAGNVGGCVDLTIYGGSILGSVYGGGRLASVGYGLYLTTETGYGIMRADNVYDDPDNPPYGAPTNAADYFGTKGRGHINVTINGGTIGNDREYTYDANNQLSHTKGGNVFAGGMGRMYKLGSTTEPISSLDWWKLGCAKSTKLTITGGTIKSNVYGGGELGQVVGCHTTDNVKLGTEITIQNTNNTVIGTEVTNKVDNVDVTQYTFGSVFGGGYGSLEEKITLNAGTEQESVSYPKYIAGRVMAGTKVNMTAGTVKASVYGGGEMAAVGESVVLGEKLTEGFTGDTYVTISGGTIGVSGFGGAKMGNVYGGGSGHNNTVRSGQVFGNTNVNISGADTRIYHNIYGGGAYGSVGDFEYKMGEDPETHTNKVFGVSGLNANHPNSGVATVTITGGTIGVDGRENGMVFGSSRGDINAPEKRDDHTAWVYDANVTIGDANGGPAIKGSVYGSGENGHTFNDAVVTINKGTIGILEGVDITYTENGQTVTKGGAAYPYRGNVYGGGCGTDKYYADHDKETHDGNGQLFNPLAGIVYGNATVNINGGQVVHNVYGAGAMGSVGKTTTTTSGETTTKTTTGGTTTINISGGTIGVDGTKGEGNVFGAARGDVDAISNEAALVRKTSNVSITGGTIKGNVYGGGELGCVGVYDISSDYRTFTWKNTDGTNNTAANSDNKNTGICNVIIDGSSAFINGHVFGAGKGKDDTFWCEKGIAYRTIVNVKNGTVNGNVYGGGEVGRVETDTEVKVGLAPGEGGGTSEPTINGSVFGGGAGVETHGYSALVRGNTTVTVDQNAHVTHSVYGGGEIASVGKYGLDTQNMPSILQGGGYCYVTVKGNAAIAEDVFGAGKGVTPHFDKDNLDETKRSRRMTLKSDWKDRVGPDRFAWDYLPDEAAYSTYLETLALATHPELTIDGSATVSGSVFGGGELGLTKGSVIVNIQGGTITEDVYGGGKLANSNTTSTVAKTDENGNLIYTDEVLQTEEVHPTTTVNLHGGLIKGDAYGGGLGQKTGFYDANGVIATSDIEATVYGDITVNLGTEGTPASGDNPAVPGTATAFNIHYEDTGDNEAGQPIKVVQSGRVFGCNNLNGSPQGNVTVNVYKTVEGTLEGLPNARTAAANYKKKEGDEGYVAPTYELAAVYGGGNLADYTATGKKASVIIHTCDVSVRYVYGGGNAAAVPETDVLVKGAWEIEHVFGGGNGKDKYKKANYWMANPGANVLGNTNTLLIGGYIHEAYGGSNESGTISGNVTINTNSKDDRCVCDLELEKLYGAGKNADIDGDLIVVLDCAPESKTDEIYGGAENANVRGNVELTITSGTFGRVFGGNNQSGSIFGHIILNIEETSCRPIIIDELYGCGNNAAYSVYGYKEGTNGTYVARTSLDDGVAVTFNKDANQTAHTTPQYADPQVNIISCTRIGKVFGGGYGSGATVYGNPTVNINQIPGQYAAQIDSDGNDEADNNSNALGVIGEVFGGGNAANVVGNTNVNIGTETEVWLHQSVDANGNYTMYPSLSDPGITVQGANITGNVYGGGNKAEVSGDTNVNIGRRVE